MSSPGDHQFLDTLKISDTQWRKLAEAMRAANARDVQDNNRRHQRIDYVGRVRDRDRELPATLDSLRRPHPRSYTGGMGFVHGGFFHVGSPCRVMLVSLNRQVLAMTGMVKRCHHLKGKIHDIGIEFDAPVEVASFITTPEPGAEARPA